MNREQLIERAPSGRPEKETRRSTEKLRATLEDESRRLVDGSPQFERIRGTLDTVLRHVQPVLDKIEELEGQRDDYTDEAFDRRMAARRGRLDGALAAALDEFDGDVAALYKQFPQQGPTRYPVPSVYESGRTTVLLAQVNALPLREAAKMLDDMIDRDDKLGIQTLLPLVRSRLERDDTYREEQTQAPIGEPNPVADTVAAAELHLADLGMFAGQYAREAVEKIRPQVAEVIRALVDEGKWEGSLSQRAEAIHPDGTVTPAMTPDLQHVGAS